jgi:hypothetical protein
MKMKPILTIVLASLAMVACEKQAAETTVSETLPDSAFEKYFTDESIPDAEAIHIARTTAKPGEEIILSGLVMGREKVFVDGRASFILGDPSKLTPCNKMPDDHCETPWDACCDNKELKLEGTASIQIAGEDGRVLNGNIRGTKGLKELSTVTVAGKVAPQSTPDALIVNATAIHVSEP